VSRTCLYLGKSNRDLRGNWPALTLALAVWMVLALVCDGQITPDRGSFARLVQEVQPKLVKIYGAGGYIGVTDYCSGVLVSPDGLILTVYSPTLDTENLRVHLYDGTRHECDLLAAEPVLDAALLKIRDGEKKFRDLPLAYFDLDRPTPKVQVGDWVLAFSNCFQIATREEPLSVQRSVVAAITNLSARRGIHELPYQGTVYILDGITNNPGSHGGAVVTRRGELIGLIGKEVRNTLTETWVNYAIPIEGLRDFVKQARSGNYKPLERKKADRGRSRWLHGHRAGAQPAGTYSAVH
jgi:S1-C subfamily serine protease